MRFVPFLKKSCNTANRFKKAYERLEDVGFELSIMVLAKAEPEVMHRLARRYEKNLYNLNRLYDKWKQ